MASPSATEVLGAGATGAGIGSSFGPIGTAVGFGAGVIGDLLFGGKDPAEQYVDPNKGAVDQTKYQLLNSHVGADLASRRASQAKRAASLTMDNIKNRPGFGNAAVLDDLYGAANRSAEGSAMDANLQGAAYDQNAKLQGAGLAERQSVQDRSIWKMNKALRDQPNALESVGLSTMGNLAGKGADGLTHLGGLGSSDGGSQGTGLSSAIQSSLGGDLGKQGRGMQLPGSSYSFDNFLTGAAGP